MASVHPARDVSGVEIWGAVTLVRAGATIVDESSPEGWRELMPEAT